MKKSDKISCSTFDMFTYSTGDCAISLIMNSAAAFSMIYFSDALGMKHSLIGLGMFVAIFWDAVSDPIMGHISDNTRSRFGRRLPYMLVGGLLMVACFYFLWAVPEIFKNSSTRLFAYLISLNLLLRTAFTIFVIPHSALGFEICKDYNGRTRLQGIKTFMSMAANMLGPALAWAIFFENKDGVRATGIAKNYVHMGTVFTIGAAVFIIIVLNFTKKYMADSRDMKISGNSLKSFFVDIKEIIMDKYPRWVFAYIFIVLLGIALLSSLQMYLYEHFFRLSGIEKTFAHGGTMVGMALGALCASKFTKRFDKKGAVYIGGVWSVFCNVLLAVLFLPGYLKPGQETQILGTDVPIAFIIFVIFHGLYWMGNGIMLPIASSMIADISEINEIRTGVNKDGAYAAMYSFAMKSSFSVAILLSGYCLTYVIGFVSGTDVTQSEQVVWRLGAVTLLVGPVISLIALLLIKKYPVTQALINSMREKKEQST